MTLGSQVTPGSSISPAITCFWRPFSWRGLGPYSVTAKIGEGGLGEVYQATDTKLNRQVALKILPEAFATDLDRLARFAREAHHSLTTMTRTRLLVPLLLVLLFPASPSSQEVDPSRFTLEVVATGLEYPWEVIWGPDDYLWVTERTAKRITRVDPVDGAKHVAVTIPEAFQSVAQDGVLGLALHPGPLAGADEVYVAFTYRDRGRSRLKIRRFSYNPATGSLEGGVDVLSGLPAHDDHLGGRLAIGPDQKLYVTIGDQGGNWLQNYCNLNLAQELPTAADVAAGDWSTYAGKNPAGEPRWVDSHGQSVAGRRAQPRLLLRPPQPSGAGLRSRRLCLRLGARSEHRRRAEPGRGRSQLRMAARRRVSG